MIPNQRLLAQYDNIEQNIDKILADNLQVNDYWCSGTVTAQQLDDDSLKYIVICETEDRIEAYTIKINPDGTSEIKPGFPP